MRLRRTAYFVAAAVVVNLSYASNAGAVNLRNAAISQGWDGLTPVTINVTVTSTGVLQSFGASTAYALDSGTLPVGSSVWLTVAGGQIWGGAGYAGTAGIGTGSSLTNGGNGGNGGNAIRTTCPMFINSTGVIAGGGGGGGGGGGARADGVGGNPMAFASGGAGGIGQSYNTPVAGGGAGYTSNPSGGALATSGAGGGGGYAGLDGGAGANGSIGGNNSGGGATAGGLGGLGGKAIVGGEWVNWASVGDVRGAITNSSNTYIPTPAATPAVGAAFEGGIYTGNLLWQEVAQSSTVLFGGNPSFNPFYLFVVPAMVGNPMFYAGQSLEVRSRSNPANKVVCTVLGATGANLTVRASAGFTVANSDWSIMARYRIIDAPPATGETTLPLMGADVPMPLECITLTEGAKATAAMVAAGDATAFPAAHYVRSLVIGGKADWYIGARNEDEGGWRYNKPASVNNYVTADRPVSTRNYATLGSLADTGAGHGVNNSATPARTAYTAASPAQVAAGLGLRTGEVNARAYPGATYLSCSEASDTEVWAQRYDSTEPGRQVLVTKTTPGRIRAKRRSII